MCSETSEAVGTTWEHAQLEFQKFLKIRITLPLQWVQKFERINWHLDFFQLLSCRLRKRVQQKSALETLAPCAPVGHPTSLPDVHRGEVDHFRQPCHNRYNSYTDVSFRLLCFLFVFAHILQALHGTMCEESVFWDLNYSIQYWWVWWHVGKKMCF